MKHIMISINPEWVEKILNREKRWELRLSCPEDECIVEIYCTKDPKHLVAPFRFVEGWFYKVYDDNTNYACGCTSNMGETINGKVVARFWLNKSAIYKGFNVDSIREVSEQSKVSALQIYKYSNCGTRTIYAWFIDDLRIYDTPKELAEFGLKRPFQSWGYLKDE